MPPPEINVPAHPRTNDTSPCKTYPVKRIQKQKVLIPTESGTKKKGKKKGTKKREELISYTSECGCLPPYI
jgi:hypothetical protein